VDILRAERILAFLLAYGLLSPKRLLRPEIATLWDLGLAHGRRYLEKLRSPDSLTEIVGTEVWPELWVDRDIDYDRAKQLIDANTIVEESPQQPWRCRKCGEENEGQFAACWNCGTEAR